MTIIGTLQINRKGIPAEIKQLEGREEFSYKIIWNTENINITMHSYVVRTKSTGPRNVLLLTSMKPIIGTTTDDKKKKPAILKLYDFTKGGTDIVDQRAQTYTTKAKSNRWTMVSFYFLLDTCRVNASTIYAMNNGQNPRNVDSFDFGWDLVEALTMPFIRQRQIHGLSVPVQRKISTALGDPAPPRRKPELEHEQIGERRRCRLWIEESYGEGHKRLKQKMPKKQTQCQTCGNPACKRHLVYICETCYLAM